MKIKFKDGGVLEITRNGWVPVGFLLVVVGLIGALINEIFHVL
jgi:hypothetical protein